MNPPVAPGGGPDWGGLPFYSIGHYLKTRFGGKVIKLALDGGFTCPNRDGSVGAGGCIFCSADGSGEFASDIPGQIALLSGKWPAENYIAYFQSHTNTYAPAPILRRTFASALAYPLKTGKIVGLAVATRPDCLGPEVLDLLEELSQRTFLWVELGLQTAHDSTARLINRCYPLPVFEQAMAQLAAREIPAVVHLILGLPRAIENGRAVRETRGEMLESVRYVGGLRPFGVKLHLLNVVRGSKLERLCPTYAPFADPEEYISLVCDALALLPPQVTIHRLTADAPRKILLAPEWSYKKRTILNGIQAELKRRGAWQGCALPESFGPPQGGRPV